MATHQADGAACWCASAYSTTRTPRDQLSAQSPAPPLPPNLQLGTLIERELTVARTLLAQGRKDRARLALRKKRLQEAQLDRLDGWLLNVEEMVRALAPAFRVCFGFAATVAAPGRWRAVERAEACNAYCLGSPWHSCWSTLAPKCRLQLLSVESAQRSAKIFTALKQGNDALKQLQSVRRAAGLRRTPAQHAR